MHYAWLPGWYTADCHQCRHLPTMRLPAFSVTNCFRSANLVFQLVFLHRGLHYFFLPYYTAQQILTHSFSKTERLRTLIVYEQAVKMTGSFQFSQPISAKPWPMLETHTYSQNKLLEIDTHFWNKIMSLCWSMPSEFDVVYFIFATNVEVRNTQCWQY